MSIVIDGQIYYRTAEVCRMVGISRNTLFKWLKEGKVSDVEYRDWRGWRLFSLAQVEAIKTRTSCVSAVTGRN